MMKHKYVFAALAAFAFMFASSAWALPGPTSATFAKGAKFTVEGYAAGKPALTGGFPVLVRIAENSPLGFSYNDLVSKTTGEDIAFVDMNGSGLPFEIDTWNTNGTSLIWVRLPSMQNGTEFVMCWGGATSGKAVCGDNPFAGYKGVWHMNATNVVDASGSGNNGTVAGNADVAAGRIGSALSLPNKSDYVTCGQNQSNAQLKDGFTVEGWANLANLSGNHCIFGKNLFVSLRTSGNNKIQVTTPGKKDHDMNATVPAAGTWWHVVLTFQKNTGNGCKVYVNGALAVQTGSGDIQDQSNATEMWLGRNQWGNDQNFQGLLDEMRLSAGIKSADWIAATYATQSDVAFLTAGEATPYGATAEPQVGVVATDVQYTNATLSVSIGSLGMNAGMTADASWLDAVVLVATEDTFASPVISIPLARFMSAPTVVAATVVPLATNTTYYAKVLATNEFAVVGESSVAHFTMHAPGVPTGTAAFMERGFSTLSARATASNIGIGAESATMRLEASTDGFATISASSESPATLNEQASFIVNGLTPGTEYALRVRIRNDWGIDTYIPLPDTSTRSVPLATTGIGWTFSQDGSAIDITFGISGIYDGATGTATLTYDGQSIAPEKSVPGTGALTWPAIPAANGTAAATVVLSATLDNQTYSQTFSATIAPGSMAVAVADFADHQATTNAVLLHVGDVATLPELVGTDNYAVGNKLFGSLKGNVLTALRPGILAVRHMSASGATNSLPVIVLPEVGGSGEIYVFDETCTGNKTFGWDKATTWWKVSGKSENKWPQNPDDVAMFPFFNASDGYALDLKNVNVEIGALYAGKFKELGGRIYTREQGNGSQIVFRRTDGKPIVLQMCPNASSSATAAEFSWGSVRLEFTSDVVLSGGWDGSATTWPRGRMAFGGSTTCVVPEGTLFSIVEFDGSGTSMGCTFELGQLIGGATIWNRSAANIKIGGTKLAEFTGVLRDSSHGNENINRSGPIFVRTASGTNTLYELAGFVHNDSSRSPSASTSGVGLLCTGWENGYGNENTVLGTTNYFPGRGLVMHGGTFMARDTENSGWGIGNAEFKRGETLSVADGFNYIARGGDQRSNNAGHPINWVEFGRVSHDGKATLFVWDRSRFNPPVAAETNFVFVLHGISSHAAGPVGDPESSDSYPTVPWIVSPLDGGYDKIYFSSFDSVGRLVRPVLAANNTALSAFSSGRNAYCRNAGIALTEDLTVNSLYLQNDTKGKTLGAGRKLTVTSGGLILSDVNDKNNPGSSAIGAEGGSENGVLVLGDADHPAYVWACGATTSSANVAPNQIWADVSAPGGFVAAYTGNLILGGDQTGIGDEIAVNAGSLQLGSADNSCQLAKDLPIRIYANATLKLPNDSSTTGNILKFDGAAGWFGKVEVPEGVAAKCKKAYWRDYPEAAEWQVLKRGIYGSSESGAPNVRDDLFSGAGTLQILRDDSTMPFFIIVR